MSIVIHWVLPNKLWKRQRVHWLDDIIVLLNDTLDSKKGDDKDDNEDGMDSKTRNNSAILILLYFISMFQIHRHINTSTHQHWHQHIDTGINIIPSFMNYQFYICIAHYTNTSSITRISNNTHSPTRKSKSRLLHLQQCTRKMPPPCILPLLRLSRLHGQQKKVFKIHLHTWKTV